MRIPSIYAGLGLILMMNAGAGRGDTIQLTTSAAFRSDGVLIDSQDDAATSGSSTASAFVPNNLGAGLPPNFGAASSTASANDQGVSAASAGGVFYGGTTTNILEAMVTIGRTAINEGPVAQAYAFDFTISAPTLLAHVYDGVELTEEGAPTLSYEVEVRTGSTVLWSSYAKLVAGGMDGLVYQLEKGGVDMGGTLVTQGSNVIGYMFDAFQGRVDLGMIAAGDSVTVETVLRVQVTGRGTEVGGLASIGDPNDLAGAGGSFGAIVPAAAAVPEPTAIVLAAFGAPLAALGFAATRRRAA